MSYYRGLKYFRDSFTDKGRRHPTYRRIDYLVETYFRNVKDLSHHLFHVVERQGHEKVLQVTFDLSFGIVFHMLLKNKETIRLDENYNLDHLRKVVEQLRRSSGEEYEEAMRLFNSLRASYEHDLAELDGEWDHVRESLDETERVFSKIISVYAGNATIMRTLFESHRFFLTLFPHEGVDHIFKDMYPDGGPAKACIFLGFDFVRSGHIVLAERAFRRAARAIKNLDNWKSVDFADIYRQERRASIGGNPARNTAVAERLKRIEEFERDSSFSAQSFA